GLVIPDCSDPPAIRTECDSITASVAPRRLKTRLPLAASHMRTSESSTPHRAQPAPPLGTLPLDVTMRPPSGLKATSVTKPRWPVRVATNFPVDTFQTREVMSALAVTTRVSSGLNTAL